VSLRRLEEIIMVCITVKPTLRELKVEHCEAYNNGTGPKLGHYVSSNILYISDVERSSYDD